MRPTSGALESVAGAGPTPAGARRPWLDGVAGTPTAKPRYHSPAESATRASLCFAVMLLASTWPALAQGLDLGLGQGGSLGQTALGMIALLTLLSLVPGLAVMITCFPLIVTVLSILRQALGLQQAPPNMLIVSLALFLSWFVMEPVFNRAWQDGLGPYAAGEITLGEAVAPSWAPFRTFIEARTDPEVLARMEGLRGESAPASEVSPAVLVPSFLLSELGRAFRIGFLIFLPFLIIDLVVAAVLMSMGMMMVPPAIVALPFKLAFFVIADGWSLIAEALVRSYV